MTTNQQQIIDALVNELNRIEAMHKPSTTFSLINVDALNDKTNEIKRYKMQEEAERLAWTEMANEEARRLVKLFKSDLPNASIQKYGDGNSFYYLPSVLIRRDENTSTHHESCVNVEVVVVRRNDVKDSFGNYYDRGIKLNYRYNYGKEEFETIEELVSNHYFLESVRNRVL
jgi:hypothetical protein